MRGDDVWKMGLGVLALIVAAGGAIGGCGTNYVDAGRDCTPEEAARFGCESCPYTCDRGKPDAGTDAGEVDAGASLMTCDGQCVPMQPLGWFGPLLLWTGPGPEVPACPSHAPDHGGYTWYGDLQVPPSTCGTCSCTSPVGACTLPTSLTASSSICADAPGTHTTMFDAPAGWSGACTSLNPISAGEQCGSSLCVESLTLAPLHVTTGTCSPVTTSPPQPPPPTTWGTVAAVCQATTFGKCDDSTWTCMPADAPGFDRCVYLEGERPCPPMSPYAVRHVLYTGVSDTRGCAPCTCGEPVGSVCSAKVSLFEDPGCSDLFATLSIDATMPLCVDILPAGSALGSKSASPVSFTPGVCQPGGGAPSGAVEPLDPTTYCCLPAP